MIKPDPDWSQGPRRLEDFEPGELEAFMHAAAACRRARWGKG